MNTGRCMVVPALALLLLGTSAGAATAAPKRVSVATHLDASKVRGANPLGSVLYDQNASGTSFGAFVNEVIAPPPTLGNTAVGADDFVVTDTAGWTVTGFVFNAFGPGSIAPPPHITVNVYADAAGVPAGTPACSAPGTAVTYAAASHQITAALATPCVLPAAAYWVAWSFDDVDLTANVWGWWGQTTALHNHPALWWNTGGNFSPACTATWGSFAQCGIFDPSLQDFGFAALGHVNGADSGLQVTIGVAAYAGDPNECGTATSVEVNFGDQVNLCYTLTNNGTDTLTHQSIVDSIDGAVLIYDPLTIPAGGSHSYVRTIVATSDTERSATWTGYANLASYAYDDTATPDFIDISATGTDIGFTPGDSIDSELAEVTTEFPIRFYGMTTTALCIANDGIILFADTACLSPGAGQTPDPGYAFNEDIPSTFGTNVPTYLAPMWGNLGDGPGRVYTETRGTAPNRTFIVQWNDIESYAIASTGATFEVVLEENSDTVRYEYQSTLFGNEAENGAWFTVGLQADPHGLYTKYSYYQPSLHSNMAIHWNYTAAVSAAADSNSAQIAAGDPELQVVQSSLDVVVDPGQGATRTLSIANGGNRDLQWNLAEAPGGSTAHFPAHPRYFAPSGLAAAALPGSYATALGHRPQPGLAASSAGAGAGAGSFAVPAYAISLLRPGLVTFDALDPASTYTPLGNSDDVIYAGTFAGNDFSKLYAIMYDSWTVPAGTLGTVDTVTGVFTTIAPISGAETPYWAGMTEDPLTGIVYAVNFQDIFGGSAAATIYTIDLQTGQATRVGAIDGPGVHPAHYISGIAISPGGLMYGLDLYGQSLLAIDKLSGAASVIESLGLNVMYIQDIKFDVQTGDLYWASVYIDPSSNLPVGEMRVIDPLTAASQPIGLLPPAGELPLDEFGVLAIAKPSVGCSSPADVAWLSVDTTSGTIVAGGAAQDVTVTFDSTGLSAGLHKATICVFGNDPRHPTIAVPVALAVSEGALYDQHIDDTPLRVMVETVIAPKETEFGLSTEGADDFVVTDSGWAVSGFNFIAYGIDGGPLPGTVNLRVLADNGAGAPATEVLCSTSGAPAIALQSANQIGVYLTTPCELAPGTYWVAWSFAGVDFSSKTRGFWGETTELHNQPAVWRNPGGWLGGCTEWGPFAACPAQFDPALGAKDFGFSVLGSPSSSCADVVFADGFDGGGGCKRGGLRH